MIPLLYEATETEFTSNGIGRLADATYVHVSEERNGPYELEMDYPITGQYYGEITLMRLIAAVPSREATRQPFEIYDISKPINGIVTVKARHISYRLAKIVVSAFTESSCSLALAGLESHAIGSCPFEFWTDKQTSGTFTVKSPTAIRGLLGGQQGSILDVYGAAEYEFDKFLVRLYQHRGSDRGVTIAYGKNLTDITDESDSGDVYTGIVPYYLKDDVLVVGNAVYGEHRADYPYDMTVPMDFTSKYENTTPTAAQLTETGQNYISGSSGWEIKRNTKISFVDLSDTLEYKDVAALQAVNLCDTVTVRHPGLGIEAKAKVVKTDYDVLAERYESIELGAVKTGLAQAVIAPIEEELKDVPTMSVMDEAIAAGTALLAGADGGHIKIVTDANGKPQQALIMSGETEATSRNIWRWNENGIGFSNDYGTTYKQAWTIDGKFYTDWVTASVFDAGIINAGALQSSDGKVSFDLDNAILKIEKATGLQITAGNLQVDSSGNVTITGTIHASAGDVGGWEILPSRLRRTVAPTASTPGFKVELISPGAIQTDGSTAAIRVQTAAATSGEPQWENKFLVRYNGTTIVKGEIIADSGKIGGDSGLIVDTNKVYVGKTTLLSGSTGLYIGTDGISFGSFGGSAPLLWFDNTYNEVRVTRLDFYTWMNNALTRAHSILVDGKKRLSTGYGWNIGYKGTDGEGTEDDTCIGGTTYANVTTPSDRRIKKNIRELNEDKSREFILACKPISFEYSEEGCPDGVHHGLIAQDVMQIADDWDIVTGNESRYSIRYTEIITDLIKVVQGQERRIAALEKQMGDK